MTGTNILDRAVTWLVAFVMGLGTGYALASLQDGGGFPRVAVITPAPVTGPSAVSATSPSTPATSAPSARRELAAPAGSTPATRPPGRAAEPEARGNNLAARSPFSAPGVPAGGRKGEHAPSPVVREAIDKRLSLLLDALAAAIREERAIIARANTLAELALAHGRGALFPQDAQPPAHTMVQLSVPPHSAPPAPASSQAHLILPSTEPPGRTAAGGTRDRQSPGPLYRVTGGPIYDLALAQAIVAQLAHVGLVPALATNPQGEPERYRVASESLLPGVAGRRAAGLDDLHPDRVLLANGRVRLAFGEFASEQEAQDFAERIRARGYFASAEQVGGTAYTVVLSPARRPAADASIAIIKATGADVRIRVDVVP